MKLLVLSVCWLSFAATTNAYKILVLVPMNGKSHWIYMQTFIEELVHRGHEVTCITSQKFIGPKPQNYSEVLIDPPLDISKLIKNEDFFSMGKYPILFNLPMFPAFMRMAADYALNNTNVKEFINRNDLQFDLVINEEIFHESWLMFGHKYKAPIVTICPSGVFDSIDQGMGLLTSRAHVSHTMLPYSDNMSFSQRWYNSLVSTFEWILRVLYHLPAQNEIAKRHFGHLGPIPSVEEMIANVSLILANAHRSLFHPRPSMPTLINIGGAQIIKPKPLPADLQKFIDESEYGVILFSLGTIVPASKMPKAKINAFLESFGKLKQRVLWKFDDESLMNVPSNVLIRKWLPQNDILAHPNIVLFISHGGMFSNFESVAHGVPMIMIPFIGDQFRNAIKVQEAGYGKILDYSELTKESLTATLNEMLLNKKYSEKAKEISAIFNDNMVHPMDEAMWWIEYVARFKGAKHLKSHAVNMSWFQYLLLDVILVNIVGTAIVLYALYSLIIKTCCPHKLIVVSNKKKN